MFFICFWKKVWGKTLFPSIWIGFWAMGLKKKILGQVAHETFLGSWTEGFFPPNSVTSWCGDLKKSHVSRNFFFDKFFWGLHFDHKTCLGHCLVTFWDFVHPCVTGPWSNLGPNLAQTVCRVGQKVPFSSSKIFLGENFRIFLCPKWPPERCGKDVWPTKCVKFCIFLANACRSRISRFFVPQGTTPLNSAKFCGARPKNDPREGLQDHLKKRRRQEKTFKSTNNKITKYGRRSRQSRCYSRPPQVGDRRMLAQERCVEPRAEHVTEGRKMAAAAAAAAAASKSKAAKARAKKGSKKWAGK